MSCRSVFNANSVSTHDSMPCVLGTSHMVAVPVVDSRHTTISTGAHPSTRTKLIPRKGVNDAWTDELNDLLSSNKLTDVSRETGPPSLQDAIDRLPNVATHIIEAVHGALISEWWGCLCKAATSFHKDFM